MKNFKTRINVYQNEELYYDGKLGEYIALSEQTDNKEVYDMLLSLVNDGTDVVNWRDEEHDIEYKAAVYVTTPETDREHQIWYQGFQAGQEQGERCLIQKIQHKVNDSGDMTDVHEIQMYIYNLWEKLVH